MRVAEYVKLLDSVYYSMNDIYACVGDAEKQDAIERLKINLAKFENADKPNRLSSTVKTKIETRVKRAKEYLASIGENFP